MILFQILFVILQHQTRNNNNLDRAATVIRHHSYDNNKY